MFLYTIFLIFYIVALPCMSFGFTERRLFCSSEHASVWYSYEGPLYYLSATGSPCSQEEDWHVITYTVIPMFTVARIGYIARVYDKGQLFFEYTQPHIPCEDVKVCYIIKGETLHDTFPFYLQRFLTPQGVYEVYLDVNIVDDAEKMLTLHFNITAQVKSPGSKNAISGQLGGL